MLSANLGENEVLYRPGSTFKTVSHRAGLTTLQEVDMPTADDVEANAKRRDDIGPLQEP